MEFFQHYGYHFIVFWLFSDRKRQFILYLLLLLLLFLSRCFQDFSLYFWFLAVYDAQIQFCLYSSCVRFFPFLLCLLLLFFSQLFVRPPQTTILPFCISFFWGWSWSLPPVQCHEPLFMVLQTLLSGLIPWIYLSLPLYNRKGFDLDHTWIV